MKTRTVRQQIKFAIKLLFLLTVSGLLGGCVTESAVVLLPVIKPCGNAKSLITDLNSVKAERQYQLTDGEICSPSVGQSINRFLPSNR